MKTICLDTTILIDLERGIHSARKTLEDLLEQSFNIATTSISIFEMAYGAHLTRKKEENLDALRALSQDLEVWEFDSESGFTAGRILAHLRKKGTLVEYRDVFIASIALVNGCNQILTANIRDFKRIPGIELVKYKSK